MEIGPTTPLCDGRNPGGMPNPRCPGVTGACLPPAKWGAGPARGQSAWRQTRSSDLLVFGQNAPAKFASKNMPKPARLAQVNNAQVESIISSALAPFRTARAAPALTKCSTNCRTQCRIWSGLCAGQDEMEKALEKNPAAQGSRPKTVSIRGNRDYNPGLGTPRSDLANLLDRSRSCWRYRQWSAGKAVAAIFREDFPEKSPDWSTFNHVVRPRGRRFRHGGRNEARGEPRSSR